MNDPKVSVKYVGTDLSGDHYTVTINGRKYPRERGQHYIGTHVAAHNRALCEWRGWYISRSGEVFKSKQEYLNSINASDESEV